MVAGPKITTRHYALGEAGRSFPTTYSLMSAQDGLVADVNRRADRDEVLVLSYDPASPATVQAGENQTTVPGAPIGVATVDLILPP